MDTKGIMSTDNHLSTVQLPRRYQRTGDFTEQDGRVPEPDGTSIEPARAVWWNGAEGPVSGQFPQRGSHSPGEPVSRRPVGRPSLMSHVLTVHWAL